LFNPLFDARFPWKKHMRLTVLFLIILAELCVPGIILAGVQPARPFPQHIRYAPGTIKPNFPQAVLDNDVRTFFDRWKADYLVSAGTAPNGAPMYRVIHSKNAPQETVSEGQGYGMIIMALMAGYDPNARAIIDGLWTFARQHPSSVDHRLMAWQVPENPDTGIDAAFDGDADMAYALLLADNQWGSNGPVNYRQEAERLLAAIMEAMIGPQSHLPMLGDWVNREGSPYSQYTPRSSDFMPGHFRCWYTITGNNGWIEALHATQAAIAQVQADYGPTTGLLPDFLVPMSTTDHRLKPAPPGFLEGPDDGHYEYNAGRDPWRIGTDALLNNDPVSLAQTQKIADWIHTATGGKAENIKDGYFLDGGALRPENDFTTFFASPFGVAAMTRSGYQAFLDDIYARVKQRHEDYFEDSVTLLCMLVMTGNFWAPVNLQFPATPQRTVIPPMTLLLLRH
jgi:hypothetical protein